MCFPGTEPEGFVLGHLSFTEEQKNSMKGRNKGKKWYNNGIVNRKFYPDEKIPDDYVLGCLPFTEEHKNNMRGKR